MQVMDDKRVLSKCGVRLSVSLMLVVCCLCGKAAAQEPVSIPTVSLETHQRVLDLIFPRDSGDFSDHTKEFSLTLRFLPSFKAGSQINITKYSDGRLEVVTYTLPKSNQSIGEQLSDILQQTGREDAGEMAKRLNVQKRTINNAAMVRQLLRRFSSIRFSPLLDTSITLDGTGFELWHKAASNEAYYSLVGGEPKQDRGYHPLVRWMNEVRQTILN